MIAHLSEATPLSATSAELGLGLGSGFGMVVGFGSQLPPRLRILHTLSHRVWIVTADQPPASPADQQDYLL